MWSWLGQEGGGSWAVPGQSLRRGVGLSTGSVVLRHVNVSYEEAMELVTDVTSPKTRAQAEWSQSMCLLERTRKLTCSVCMERHDCQPGRESVPGAGAPGIGRGLGSHAGKHIRHLLNPLLG